MNLYYIILIDCSTNGYFQPGKVTGLPFSIQNSKHSLLSYVNTTIILRIEGKVRLHNQNLKCGFKNGTDSRKPYPGWKFIREYRKCGSLIVMIQTIYIQQFDKPIYKEKQNQLMHS